MTLFLTGAIPPEISKSIDPQTTCIGPMISRSAVASTEEAPISGVMKREIKR